MHAEVASLRTQIFYKKRECERLERKGAKQQAVDEMKKEIAELEEKQRAKEVLLEQERKARLERERERNAK